MAQQEKPPKDDKSFDFAAGATATAEVPKSEAGKSGSHAVAVDTTETTEKRGPGRPKKTAATTTSVSNAPTGSTVQPEAAKPKAAKTPAVPEKPKTPKEKFLADVLSKAGIDQIPTIEELFRGIVAPQTATIRDIACFIGNDQDEPVLKELAGAWTARNTIHPVAEVSLRQAAKVGSEILSDGRMFFSLEVAKIKDASDKLEAVSGRHRLIFLALTYGLDVKVPVVVKEYTKNEACVAAIRANESRSQSTMEKAEHRVAVAVDGNLEVEREELFKRAVKKRSEVANFAVVSVVHQGMHGAKLRFKLLDHDSEKGVTTLGSVMGFWKKALGSQWKAEMTRAEFDAKLKESVEFLNELVETMESTRSFDRKQHLATMPLVAVGGAYAMIVEQNEKVPTQTQTKQIAKAIVAMGDIARQKSETTRKDLWKELK